MEENEKAEETTQIILSLQKQAREIEELTAETIDGEKSQALAALAKGDVETALMLYEKVQEAYVEMGDEASAQEMGVLIESLQEQMDSVQDMEEPEPSFEASCRKRSRRLVPKDQASLQGPDCLMLRDRRSGRFCWIR